MCAPHASTLRSGETKLHLTRKIHATLSLRLVLVQAFCRAELRQLESQLKEASAKIAALQKRKSESDAAAGRVEKHLKSALGELTGVCPAFYDRRFLHCVRCFVLCST